MEPVCLFQSGKETGYMEDIKETVGKVALDLMSKDPEVTTVIDQQRAMQEDYLEELTECVMEFRRKHPRDFFVTVLTKSEKLMPNVFRNYFVPRLSCPTPNYDQAVYRYRHEDEEIEFIWSIPCREACFYLRENTAHVSTEEHELLQYVVAFADGTLYHLCRHLNGEYDEKAQIV
jgi:hypothetical protein